MEAKEQTSENVTLKGEPSAPLAPPTPATFNAEAMSKVLVNAYMNIAAASAKARPLKDAYIARMQKDAGYEIAPLPKDSPLTKPQIEEREKKASARLAEIGSGERTPKGIAVDIEAGLIRLIETKPDQALVDAMTKLDGAVKDFNSTLADATRPLLVAMPTKSKNPNMPSDGATKKRTPSKGFVTPEEWAGVSATERAQYNMSYDGSAITLDDVNGEKHVCRSIKALKRHEAGEGHK